MLWRKCCFGSDGEAGSRFAERLLTVVATCRRPGRSLLDFLVAAGAAALRGAAFQPTGARTVVDQVVHDLGQAIEATDARITVVDLPMVMADAVQLAEVFQNLIGNALKFRAAESPHVHVGAESCGGDWQFAVRDNGIGIAPEHADQIFGVFRRLHSQAEYPGTGIGLAVCKRVVERHGGRIWVESRPGEGTTFCFTLPGVPT